MIDVIDRRGIFGIPDLDAGDVFETNESRIYMKIDCPFDEVNVVEIMTGEARWLDGDTPIKRLKCRLLIE